MMYGIQKVFENAWLVHRNEIPPQCFGCLPLVLGLQREAVKVHWAALVQSCPRKAGQLHWAVICPSPSSSCLSAAAPFASSQTV